MQTHALLLRLVPVVVVVVVLLVWVGGVGEESPKERKAKTSSLRGKPSATALHTQTHPQQPRTHAQPPPAMPQDNEEPVAHPPAQPPASEEQPKPPTNPSSSSSSSAAAAAWSYTLVRGSLYVMGPAIEALAQAGEAKATTAPPTSLEPSTCLFLFSMHNFSHPNHPPTHPPNPPTHQPSTHGPRATGSCGTGRTTT